MPPIGYALATSLLFSGSYIAGKYTTLDLDPLTTTFFRYLIALAFLAPLAVRQGMASLRLELRHVFPAVVLGLTGIVGYHYFFFLALGQTEVANTAIINALSPVFTGIGAALFVRERLAGKNYLGVGVAVLGVTILISGGAASSLLTMSINRGDLYMILAVLSFTVYALLIKTMVDRYSGYTLTFYATLFGVVWLLLLVPLGQSVQLAKQMSVESFYAIVYMGVAGSGVGYLTFNLSIKAIGATRTSSFVYGIIPIIVALLAYVFFSQAITLVMISSTVLILFGLKLVLGPAGKAA